VNRHFFTDEDFLHEFEYYDRKRNVSLDGLTRIFTLELGKLETVVKNPVANDGIRAVDGLLPLPHGQDQAGEDQRDTETGGGYSYGWGSIADNQQRRSGTRAAVE
jgi:hypothetical protein